MSSAPAVRLQILVFYCLGSVLRLGGRLVEFPPLPSEIVQAGPALQHNEKARAKLRTFSMDHFHIVSDLKDGPKPMKNTLMQQNFDCIALVLRPSEAWNGIPRRLALPPIYVSSISKTRESGIRHGCRSGHTRGLRDRLRVFCGVDQ
jgi:hypothetical protein